MKNVRLERQGVPRQRSESSARSEAPRTAAVEVVCSTENEAIRPTVVERIGKVVRQVKDHVVWARVKLIDVRDETGALVKRCVVQMRLRHRPQVLFAVTHPSAREAVAMAAMRLQRVLDRRLQMAVVG